MAKNKRTKIERERDLLKITDLYLRGLPQWEIAEEIGLTQQQISYDIKQIQKRWRDASVEKIEAMRAKELARIDSIEREYWEAWINSKKEHTKVKRTIDADNQPISSTIEKEVVFGDPQYMAGIRWCVEQRCKILGLYAASPGRIVGVTEDTKDGSRSTMLFDLDALSIDELHSYLALVKSANGHGDNEQTEGEIVDGEFTKIV